MPGGQKVSLRIGELVSHHLFIIRQAVFRLKHVLETKKLILLIVAVLVIFIGGCITTTTNTQENASIGLMKMGTSLSPKSFQADDFTDFFEKAKQAGEIVMWAGDWAELGRTDGGGPRVVTGLAEAYDYMPLVEVTFFTQSSGQLLRPLNETVRQDYLNGAVVFAQEHKPEYLGFGIEINVLYEKSPNEFWEFVPFYNEVYAAVKAVSPGTKVFTVFQLEKMKGLGFWELENSSESRWELLDVFESDIAAFTTYPGIVYRDPSDIPKDHYLEIAAHTSKPIAFTEIGWHSAASPAGWESSEVEQVEFVTTFFNLTRDLEVEVAIWSFLYDQEGIIEPFNSMGLCLNDAAGTEKAAWNAWTHGH